AGTHGRGFSVVAGEVKELADRAKRATIQVNKILGEIQKATNSAVLSTEQGVRAATEATRVVSSAGETIKVLENTLAQTGMVASEIMTSAKQQTVGMAQINLAIQHIEQTSTTTLHTIRQVEHAAKDLNTLSRRLAAIGAG
ncbi:methyl-accepting chemotaxis protein, partial [Singulisphaera rosea]